MGTATLNPKLFPSRNIKPDRASSEPRDLSVRAPSHVGRWVGIALGVAAASLGLWIYSQYTASKDAAIAAEFAEFRAAYAEQCNAPTYAGAVPDSVTELVVSSSVIRAEVNRQLAALRAGVSCHEVGEALRAVDLVVPRPGLVP